MTYPARRATTALPQPRNMRAEQEARERGLPLVVSFVGVTHIGNPHVFCDTGKRYDWAFVKGLEVIVAVDPKSDTRDAFASMLEHVDTIHDGYPTLVDVKLEEVASIVHAVRAASPPIFWRVRRGTPTWQQFFHLPK